MRTQSLAELQGLHEGLKARFKSIEQYLIILSTTANMHHVHQEEKSG
jgi:hypothetical protein